MPGPTSKGSSNLVGEVELPHYLAILEIGLSSKEIKKRTATMAALPVLSDSVGTKNTFMTR